MQLFDLFLGFRFLRFFLFAVFRYFCFCFLCTFYVYFYSTFISTCITVIRCHVCSMIPLQHVAAFNHVCEALVWLVSVFSRCVSCILIYIFTLIATITGPCGLWLFVDHTIQYNTSRWGCQSERAQEEGPLLYLRSDWTDRAQNWYFIRNWRERWFPQVSDDDNMQVRTCRSQLYIWETVGPITFKLGMPLETSQNGGFHKSVRVPICACSRAGSTSISRKRLHRLSSKSVCC